MNPDESLPRAAFLLAFDLRKERLTDRGGLGCLLRAAALAELVMRGNLADQAGCPRALHPPADPGPLQAALWEQVAGSPPRSWRHWIRKDRSRAFRLVRDELEAAHLIRVERRRLLLFTVERITPCRPYLSRRLAERVGRAVSGGRPGGRLGEDVRVLAALATAARLDVAMPKPEWHDHPRGAAALTEPVEPVATSLRRNLDAAAMAATEGLRPPYRSLA
ncbi:GPP34 family phosphoprotein [Nonomuraea phyllanthi]|uniref:GPP34 family phosphoprotein n=1 Tax=Nonomuraea phyllanthi TaxID=2219224 RepID=A0A5C4WHA3_9ACTN|nr:GPP34 family phosphoprotein [Nonomuraea phyllanthi]KAB8193482.1 GPP34 family phosphoprotein [Nonomuraea phyllanthi]